MSNSTLPPDFIHESSLAISRTEVASFYFYVSLTIEFLLVFGLGRRDEVDDLKYVPTDFYLVIGVNDEL